MTNEEAIEYMEIAKVDQKLYPEYVEAIEFAINALEKQVSVKPIKQGMEDSHCKYCGLEVRTPEAYCYECGQKIDWR